MGYVLSIVQGMTGTFVGLMNQEGTMVSSAYRAHRQIAPRPSWIEQDPEELWRNACDLIHAAETAVVAALSGCYVEVWQGDRRLWRKQCRRLIPNLPVYVSGSWLQQVGSEQPIRIELH